MEEKNINNMGEENEGVNEEIGLGSTSDVRESKDLSSGTIEPDNKTINLSLTDTHNTENTGDVIEEKQAEPLITDIPQAASATYAFRWDYSEQKRYDDSHRNPAKRSRGVITYVVILAVTFLLAAAMLASAILLGNNGFSSSLPMNYSDELALDSLYEYCLPSYVAISTVTSSGSEGAGSGIIITENGYISTNYHVVEDAKKITVITSNNKKYEAEYIDGDEINDIAVIKISAKGLTPAVLGNSSTVKVGERVMAIGTPFSVSYSGSMTAGHISGVDRKYAVENDNGTVNKILKLLQTDTSVNPGNSGGPLFNMNGEVIGIVTLKIAGTNYEGMGFALPIDGVKTMIFDIIENGKITDSNAGSAVQGAALGVTIYKNKVEANQKYLIADLITDLTTEKTCLPVHTDEDGDYIEYQQSSFPYTEKIYVADTEALEDAGIKNAHLYTASCTGLLVISTAEGFDSSEKLKEGDIIASANGVECESMTVLQDIIFNSRIGDKLNLEVYRDGELYTISVELGKANSMK